MKIKEKMKALTDAVASIEKQFGQGAVMILGSAPSGDRVPSFPSGSFGLDRVLGIGGYPRGRIIEIYGPESSGKTTLTLHAIAEIQKLGGVAAFVDAEHALDVTYARKVGVDADKLLVAQPDHGEQALSIVDTLISSGGVDLVVVDSVAALVPKAELEGEMDEHQVGLQARMMSKAMRKLTGVTHRTGATIFFINQIRQKIGVKFGSPETTTGGNALKFYASVRIDVRRIGSVKTKESEDAVGNKTRVKVVKNKMAPPFRKAEFEIRFGEGINRIAEVFDLAVEQDAVKKSGAYFSLDGERLAHGRDNALAHLAEHPEIVESLTGRLDETDSASENTDKKDKGEKAA
ncbi:MAG: recombinase RecA [Deltaproteobacteria bacterium]|nr:recombinase RecA [Deltaproteobacteria bacterium]